MTDRSSFGPQHVARAVEKAIGSRWPRARYVAPWFLALPLALLPLLPTWLVDALFRRVFGLKQERCAAARGRGAGAVVKIGVALVTLGVLVALAWSVPARADDVGADLRGYYGGERLSAYVVGGTGAAAAASGASS